MLLLVILVFYYGAEAEICDPPKLTINTQRLFYGTHIIPYGKDIVLHCTSKNASNLIMKEHFKPVQVEQINTTTVKFVVSKPDVGYNSFHCATTIGCDDNIGVQVRPSISLISSFFHRKLDAWRYAYFVPLGAEYEVICSSNDRGLSLSSFTKERTEIVNETTIKGKAQAENVEDKEYDCNNYNLYRMHDSILVTVDYYPEGKMFQCVISKWSTLECSWTSFSDKNTFKLVYTNEEDTIHICNTGNQNNKCVLNRPFSLNQDFTLTLTTCNSFFCSNQSFVQNTDSLIKLNPVSNLHLDSVNFNWVKLTWINAVEQAMETFSFDYISLETCVYKLEYRLIVFGEWQVADMSSMKCSFHRCELSLHLPYPNEEYEIQVYTKLKTADERLWSDPVYIPKVITEPRTECTCNTSQMLFISSVEKAQCDTCKLIENIIDESFALKKRINISLRGKLDYLNKYTQLMAKSKEINRELKSFG